MNIRSKLFISLILSFIILSVFACAANASSGTYNNLTWEIDEEGLLTISGTGEMKGFLSDSTEAWHPYQYEITKVIINSGVTSIGVYAFDGCSYLTSITIPNTVTKIRMCAFNECLSLKNIVIPDSVTELGDSAFYKCKNLEKIILPSGLKKIDSHTFLYCENLTEIHIPSTVTIIKAQAFSGCKKLASINLPEGLTEIEQNAFFICYDLKTISLPLSLKKIGDYAFYECRNIQHVFYRGTESDKEKIIIGSDYSNFQDAKWHYEVNESNIIRLPDGSKIVEENAFENTSASIYIVPEGATTLLAGSFSELKHAAKIFLPESLINIDDNAFIGSENVLFICPNKTCYAYDWLEQRELDVITR